MAAVLTVPFSKKCLFKGTITNQTTQEVKEFFEKAKRLMLSRSRNTRQAGRGSKIGGELPHMSSHGGAHQLPRPVHQESTRLMSSVGSANDGPSSVTSNSPYDTNQPGSPAPEPALDGAEAAVQLSESSGETRMGFREQLRILWEDLSESVWEFSVERKEWAVDYLSDVWDEASKLTGKQISFLLFCIVLTIQARARGLAYLTGGEGSADPLLFPPIQGCLLLYYVGLSQPRASKRQAADTRRQIEDLHKELQTVTQALQAVVRELAETRTRGCPNDF